MGVKRRDFLKMAGAAAAGVAAPPAAEILLGGSSGAKASAEAETKVLNKGKRWAMVVDMRKLTEEDAHAAVEACHREHNVPDIRRPDGSVNTKEEIKWIWTDEFHYVFPDQAGEFQTELAEEKDFLVLCNHCTNPPCVRVCPTQATFKRPDGIVVMDMHRCIGCRFCMAGCPYGSRSFNWGDPRPWIRELNYEYPTRMKGVVEKCNFCAERLAKGLYPACVEAVKSGALAFGDLDSPDSEVRELIRKHHTIRRKPSLGTGPNIYYIV